MTKQLLLATILLFSISVFADSEQGSAEVMMLGVFHFSSPGLDKVKTKHIDVTTPDNQWYLQQLAQRIGKQYSPDKILVECAPEEQSLIDERFQQFLQGEYDLPVNEIYQLGFRVAKAANTPHIVCFDNRELGWDAEALFAEMPNKAPQTQTQFNKLIEQVTTQSNQMHATQTLKQLLQTHNSVEFDNLNKSLYLLTNDVGVGDSYSGAKAAASWWHRNFRMYANVQHHAQPGQRVLVIGGQGHTAILKDLLAYDAHRVAVDVNDYL